MGFYINSFFYCSVNLIIVYTEEDFISPNNPITLILLQGMTVTETDTVKSKINKRVKNRCLLFIFSTFQISIVIPQNSDLFSSTNLNFLIQNHYSSFSSYEFLYSNLPQILPHSQNALDKFPLLHTLQSSYLKPYRKHLRSPQDFGD